MHISLQLSALLLLTLTLYKLLTSLLTTRRHRIRARELGCQPPISVTGWDYLGILNIWSLMKADAANDVPEWFKNRTDAASKQHGRRVDTMVKDSLGVRFIMTSDPRNIQTVLAVKFRDFGLGEHRNGNFKPLLGDGIFASDGKQWEHSRSLLRPQFTRSQVSDLDLEERHVQALMRVLRVNATGWTDILDIQPLFFSLTLDSASEFLFGQSVDSQLNNLPGHELSPAEQEEDFGFIFNKAQESLATGGKLGDKYWVAHTKEFRKYCRKCHEYTDRFVNAALAKQAAKKQKPPSSLSEEASTENDKKQKYIFLDALLTSTTDPLALRNHILNILLAGRDTTASFLGYIFMLLIRHPHVFHKLRATILTDFGTYTHSRNLSFAALKNCSYLQWVMHETLRLYPVVPLDERTAFTDTTLPTGGGPDGTAPVFVPKGTPILYLTYVMQRRTDLWGADADSFRPERWGEGRRPTWDYLPFNGGPRVCLGQQFALTEAGYVVVRMLQRFEGVEGCGNSWESMEEGGVGYVKHALTLTMCLKDGVRCRLKEARE